MTLHGLELGTSDRKTRLVAIRLTGHILDNNNMTMYVKAIMQILLIFYLFNAFIECVYFQL